MYEKLNEQTQEIKKGVYNVNKSVYIDFNLIYMNFYSVQKKALICFRNKSVSFFLLKSIIFIYCRGPPIT